MFFQSLRRAAVIGLPFVLVLAGCSTVKISDTAPQQKPVATAGKSTGHPVLPPAGSGRGGYYLDDGPGEVIPDGLMDVANAEPRVEPYSRRGNSPYVVFGKRYVPFTDDRPYKVRGHGSWYGKKFHGQKTSSGEPYDMYKMTAAHPTLPIPSYARVTNVSNGRQVIVRVNDRGPFRSGRVIDLSYTAALQLGYIGHGSAELEVERLLPEEIERMAAARQSAASSAVSTARIEGGGEALVPTMQSTSLAPLNTLAPSVAVSSAQPAAPQVAAGYYLQFGAYSQIANAEAVRARIAQSAGNALPALYIEPANNLHRIYSGPFVTRDDAESIALRVEQSSGIRPIILQR